MNKIDGDVNSPIIWKSKNIVFIGAETCEILEVGEVLYNILTNYNTCERMKDIEYHK